MLMSSVYVAGPLQSTVIYHWNRDVLTSQLITEDANSLLIIWLNLRVRKKQEAPIGGTFMALGSYTRYYTEDLIQKHILFVHC